MSAVRHDDDAVISLDWSVLRRLLRYLSPYRALFVRLVLIMLSFSFLDAAIPLLTRRAIDGFAVPGRLEGLGLFATVCACFALGRGLAVWTMIRTGGRIYSSLSADVRRHLFTHMQGLSVRYFDTHAVGWLMSRVSSDTQQLSRFFAWGLVDTVDGFAKVAIMTGIMLWLDWGLALVVLAVVPPAAYAIYRFQALSLQKYRDVRRTNSEITGAFNEGIMGARTTKALVREERNLREFSELTAEMRRVSMSAAFASGLYLPSVLVLAAVGGGLALWVGGAGVAGGRVSYGTLVAFMTYTVSFFEPMKELARRFPMFQNAQAAAERIFSVLDTKSETGDENEDVTTRKPPESFAGHVRFQHVTFAYGDGAPVLRDFDLDVPPGQTVALVGDTGAGKTTVVNLLCRFYPLRNGAIRLDDIDHRTLPLSWVRGRIGMVQQTPHLFSGTIRDNVAYAVDQADDTQVRDALDTANALSFVDRLPGKLDFDVGENGDNLSTGQKQLVALARVVLADPALLVLDEATSSVDAETEALIQDALSRVLRGRTSFVIAHRLSTVRQANRILLLRGGIIAEQGSHRELIRRKGAYYELYRSQFIAQHEAQLLD
jgi:ATP-binding cassette subfamily B protein